MCTLCVALSDLALHRFEGQIAIVTGGCDGLGLGITKRLVSEGAHVTVFDLQSKIDVVVPALQVVISLFPKDFRTQTHANHTG